MKLKWLKLCPVVLSLSAAFCTYAQDTSGLIIEDNTYSDIANTIEQSNSQWANTTKPTAGQDNRSWHNVLNSRSINTDYRNTTSEPMIVAITPSGARWEEVDTFIDGQHYGRSYSGDFGGGATTTMIVPSGSSYRVNCFDSRGEHAHIIYWLEYSLTP